MASGVEAALADKSLRKQWRKEEDWVRRGDLEDEAASMDWADAMMECEGL